MLLSISLFSVVLSIFIMVSNGKKHKWSLFLSGFIFILSLFIVTHHVAVVDFNVFYAALLYNNFTPLYLLWGPLLYFYTRGVVLDQLHFRKKDLWHFVPAAIQLVLIIPYVLLPFQAKMDILLKLNENPAIVDDIPLNLLFPHRINNIIRIVLLSGYLIYNIMLLFGVFRLDAMTTKIYSEDRKKRIYQWLLLLHGIVVLILVFYSVFMFRFIQDHSSLHSEFSLVILGFAAAGILTLNILILAFPEVLYGLPRFKRQRHAEQKEIPAEEKGSLASNKKYFETIYLQHLSISIRKYFEEERPYLEYDFSMTDLAVALDLPQHHLAICFKEHLQTTFVDFRNGYRVTGALKLMDEKMDHYSIEAIGSMSGFRSRSSFYNNFKKVTGHNPKDFLQKKKEQPSA